MATRWISVTWGKVKPILTKLNKQAKIYSVSSPLKLGNAMSTVAHVTIAEYDRMIEAGMFEPREEHYVELIRGEIREMSPIYPPHESALDILSYWSFDNAPRDLVWIRNQNSLGIPELESVPQPDLFWVRRRDYSKARPVADDVLLLIEVADSSLRYDRGTKSDLYAEAGIQDYWIANVQQKVIEVHRRPVDARYSDKRVYAMGERVAPLAFPEIDLEVARIWPNAE
jgi:Uma2 family endonuclease